MALVKDLMTVYINVLDDGFWLFYDIHFKIITIIVTGNVIAEQSDF